MGAPPNRSARAHLQWMAASNGIPKSRVDEVLGLVGLSEVAGKKAGGFSLGMSQRLGLAGALLGGSEGVVVRRAGQRSRSGGHRLDS